MEYARGIEASNAVTIIMKEKGLSLQDAVNEAAISYKEFGDTVNTYRHKIRSYGPKTDADIQKERERHEREARHKCSWVECDKHEVEVPRSELKTCAGCGETRYCSRACQKNDWSRHKPACRRIK